jgi:DNA-directed RNA polymerase specialized sigma24 family protein
VATDEPFDERDAPTDAPRSLEAGAPSSDISPLVSDVPPALVPSTVTDAQLRAFLAHPDVQKRIRGIVAARVRADAPEALRDDLAQQANLDVLTSKSRPRSMDTASGWLAMVTTHSIARHMRAEGSRARWLETGVDFHDDEGPPGTAVAASSGRDDWLLSRWLAHAVAGDPRDQETFELIAYKAASSKSYEQVALEHATNESALRKRIARFQSKYRPRYRRRRVNIALALVTGALTLALLGWLFWRPTPEVAKPPPRTPLPPSTVAPPPGPPAPIAPAPTPSPSPDKPRDLKQ